MRVSIAAVTYRNLEQTRDFVESVLANTKEPFELVIVDNASEPELATYLDTLKLTLPSDCKYKLIRNLRNHGIGVGMNQAMAACTTDYVFRCDTDIEIRTPFWTSLMIDLYERNPSVGAVATARCGGRRRQDLSGLAETDMIQSFCMLIPRTTIASIAMKTLAIQAQVLARVDEHLAKPEKFTSHHRYLEAVKHWALRTDGLWDSGWPMYGMDDFDYSYAILWSDLRLVVDTRVDVLHKDESMRSELKAKRHDDVSNGARYLRTKWEIVENHWNDPEAKDGIGWHDLPWGLPAFRAYRDETSLVSFKQMLTFPQGVSYEAD